MEVQAMSKPVPEPMSKKAYDNRLSRAKQMQLLLCLHLEELWPGRHALKELQFHPPRKWAFDAAIVGSDGKLLAFEIEGGIWVKGAHVRGKHFLSDMEKYNTAAALGWRVFRFTPEQVERGEAKAWLAEHLL